MFLVLALFFMFFMCFVIYMVLFKSTRNNRHNIIFIEKPKNLKNDKISICHLNNITYIISV